MAIDISNDEVQQEAVARCVDMSPNNRVVPITGEAGTGKTSIMAHVYNELRKAGYAVVMCAPTGKAAKRIQEATGIHAMTIHRLLEYPHPGERDEKGEPVSPGMPRRNSRFPLTQRVVLADEYQTVNREIHENLMGAMPRGSVIRMFGDLNQLPPIEKGRLAGKPSAFQVALKKFDGVRLLTLHRTGEGSSVAENGRLINKGRIPKKTDDFRLHFTDHPANKLRDLMMERLDEGFNFGSNDGQLISPTKQTWVGTYKVNLLLRDLFNPMSAGLRISMPRHDWDKKFPVSVGVGDKVIWTENAYDLRDEWDRFEADEYDRDHYISPPDSKWIMNGETGIVTYISEDVMHIDVGDRVVEAPAFMNVTNRYGRLVQAEPWKSVDLAYCITTHKAQGSEWKHIAYVLNKSSSFMQSRRNLYTAVSRARLTVDLVTDQRSLSNSVFNVMSARERRNAE